MAGVHADLGAFAETDAVRVGGAPVRHVHRVEGGLEQLVLEDQPLAGRQTPVGLVQGLGQPVLPGRDRILAGVVGAVREPQLEVLAAGGVHDVHALEQVTQGLAADPGVRVADAAQLVVVVLEHVGVDGADADAVAVRVAGQGRVVVDLVPGDVHGHGGGDPGEAVHLRRVLGLLPRRAGHSRLAEYLEPRPRIPEGPGGQLDLLRAECVLDCLEVSHRGTWFLVGAGAVCVGSGHGATSVSSVPSRSAVARS